LQLRPSLDFRTILPVIPFHRRAGFDAVLLFDFLAVSLQVTKIQQIFRILTTTYFSSKCVIKNIDLDKKRMFFFQMCGKKHRFGQKTQKIFGHFKKKQYLCTKLK
jgi:hypothetical protein